MVGGWGYVLLVAGSATEGCGLRLVHAHSDVIG